MNRTDIKNALTTLSEAKVPGLDKTNQVKKEADKVNKKHYKDVAKKMADYDKSPSKGEDPVKGELTDKEKEFVDNVKGGKALQHIEYDLDPSQEFKDRAEKAMTGDSTMGNEVHVDEENGNTDSTWGASDNELGQKMVDRAKDLKKKTDDAKLDLIQFGDDIEVANNNKKIKRKEIAVENVNKMKSKKFIYKKDFNGVDNAVKLIPESYKVDGYKFQMTDGKETFDIKWEGDINEGEAVILRAKDKNLISEDMGKMQHLLSYDSKEFVKTLTNEDKINENDIFLSLLSESKKMVVKESEVNLNPKEKSILSDILGEDDGSFDIEGSSMDEGSLNEGISFEKVYQKTMAYAKKGLLTTALVAALFTSMDGFSQEQQSKLSADVEAATGLKFDNATADRLFEPQGEFKKMDKPVALDFGQYGKFGDKYFELISSNYDNNGAVIYKIMINHPLYQNKRDTMKQIVKYNYQLKEKYGKVTFEFYGTSQGKQVKRGEMQIGVKGNQ